jgi:hypothetical protein
VLHTVDRVPIATGDLLQVQRGGQIESRMVFCFTDWSLYDEAVVFTQERVFTLQSYHLYTADPRSPKDEDKESVMFIELLTDTMIGGQAPKI